MRRSKKKARLLYLVTSPAWGGAERYVARLAAAARERFDVTVMAGGSKEGALAAALPSDVTMEALPELIRPIAPLSDAKAVAALRRYIDKKKIDLIHCNSSKAGLVGALAASTSRQRPKVVYTAHGWGFLEKRSSAFRKAVLWSERLAARFRHATIVLSATEASVAEREGLSEGRKLHLIPLGMDRAELSLLDRDAARAEIGRLTEQPARFVIGTIANAYPAKALPLLIAAFSDVARLAPEADLLIVGDGPQMDEVRDARERSFFRDRIFLVGAVPEASRLLNGFDLFVLASLKEGMPWTLIEAALSGRPIVATTVGAVPEMFNEESAVLIPPGDRAALGNALVSLSADEPKRRALGERAAATITKFSATAMIERTLSLYDELLV
jgi:glycosyltransferase involved in cell wall biosynthesis